MAIEISELRSDDYDALAELWQSLEDAGPIPFESASSLTRFLQEHRGLSIAAREDGGIVAAVLCHREGDSGCTITLVVHPTHRDKDLSRQVFDKALKKLATCSIHRFRVCLPQEDDHGFWDTVKWTTTAVASDEQATESSNRRKTDDDPTMAA